MLVTIKYHDEHSFTPEEVVKLAQTNYGRAVQVEVTSDSPAPHDLIYFALQSILTHKQLSLLFERNSNYQSDLAKLRKDTLQKLEEILDQVIIDNESRVT